MCILFKPLLRIWRNVCQDDVEEQASLEDAEDIGESSLVSLESQSIGNEETEVSHETKKGSSKDKAKKPKRKKRLLLKKCSKEQVALASINTAKKHCW